MIKQFTLEDAEREWELKLTRVNRGASLSVRARTVEGMQTLLIGMSWSDAKLLALAIGALDEALPHPD